MARTQPGHWPLKLITVALAACFSHGVAALPTGASVTNGTATIAQSGAALTVTNSNRAVINWNSFSIGSGESVFFDQAATSSVLNRVVGVTVDGRRVIAPSQIMGLLKSPGTVFLINPAGTLIAPGAVIDVAGFIASSLSLSDADFLANRFRFTEVQAAGGIQNFGQITTASGGRVYLVAPTVENHGIIRAPGGEVMLAAGKSVELLDSGTPGVKVAVTAGGEALNVGQLLAESGRVGMVGAIVKQQGTVSADSVVREGGRIFLKASQAVELAAGSVTGASGTQGGTVQVESGDLTLVGGAISATGRTGSGGRIEVLGNKVGLLGGARVDVAGSTAGGTVLVGGDYRGQNAAIRNASVTYVDRNATIRADAIDEGDGGKIVVWADDTTRAYGNFSARGGASGGNGGLLETSGHRFLDIAGARADTTAAKGTTGQWLLDPGQVDIVAGAAQTNISAGPNFTPSGGVSTLGTTDLNTMLAANDVTITTVGGAGGTGDITIASGATINYNAGVARNLTLTAENDIVLQGTIQNTSTGGGLFAVALNAGNGITTPGGQSFTLTGGAGTAPIMMQINGGKTWNNYGSVTFNGQSQVHLHDGSSPAAFHNKAGATFTSNSSYGWPFYSSFNDDGDVSNWGTFNWNTNGAIEGSYSQYAGTLNIANGVSMNLQDALSITGTINLNASGTLNLTESHAGDANFSNVTFAGTGGALNVVSTNAPKSVYLTNVDAPNVAFSIGGGAGGHVFNVTNGYAVFKSVTINAGGSMGDMVDAWLGVKSAFTIPSTTQYYGDVGFYSTNSLTVADPLSAPGKLDLVAGWNGTIGSQGVTAGAGKDLIINARVESGNSMKAIAGNNLTVSGTTSDAGLEMLSSSGSQTIAAGNALDVVGTANGPVYIRSAGTQSITANSISLTAGTGASSNRAEIDASGAQTVTTTAGGLTISGSTDAEAELSSDTSQTLNIAGNVLLQGGAGANAGGALITAPTQNISIGGTLTLNAGTGSVLDSYGMAAPAAIGYDSNADITLNVGSSISLNGSNATNPAMIGAAVGTASIYMRGTDINLGNNSYVGNWDGSAGGSATLIATGSAIQQLAAGNITIGALDATANTDIVLDGKNYVDSVNLDASSGGGLISYHTWNPYTTRIRAAATGNITVYGDSGSGAIELGNITTTGAGTIDVTSQTAILTDEVNGSLLKTGVGNINLLSLAGTSVSGQLAISANVDTAGNVSASVGTSPYGSIGIRDYGASQPTNVQLNASVATSEGSVSYYRNGDLDLGLIGFTLQPGTNGGSAVGASGNISGGGLTLTGTDTLLSAGGNMSVTSSISLNGTNSNNLVVGGQLYATGESTIGSSGALNVVAGSVFLDTAYMSAGADLMLISPGDVTVSGGSISAGGKLTFLGNNMSIVGSTVSGTSGIDGTLFGRLTLGDPLGSSGFMNASNGIVDLAIGGKGIEMYNGSNINSTDPTQSAAGLIKLFFAGLSAGGSMIDTVPTFDGGYTVGGATPAVLGSGLEVTYGILSNPVSDAMIAAMNSTTGNGGGTSQIDTSLNLLGSANPDTGTFGTGGTPGTFGGNEGNNQDGSNGKKKFAQCMRG